MVYAKSPAEPGGAVAREADGAGDAAVGTEGGGRSRGARGRAAACRSPSPKTAGQYPGGANHAEAATRDTPETANQITDAAYSLLGTP